MSKPKKKMKHSMAHRRLVDCWVKIAEAKIEYLEKVRFAVVGTDLSQVGTDTANLLSCFLIELRKMISDIKEAGKVSLKDACTAWMDVNEKADHYAALALRWDQNSHGDEDDKDDVFNLLECIGLFPARRDFRSTKRRR